MVNTAKDKSAWFVVMVLTVFLGFQFVYFNVRLNEEVRPLKGKILEVEQKVLEVEDVFTVDSDCLTMEIEKTLVRIDNLETLYGTLRRDLYSEWTKGIRPIR